MLIIFDVEPKPQSRPRFNKGGWTYEDPAMKKYRVALERLAKAQMQGPPLKGPITLTVRFYLTKPKSARGREHPHVRPDIDNLYKALTDSCNEIVWVDDALIVEAHVYKLYGAIPRIEMEVNPL